MIVVVCGVSGVGKTTVGKLLAESKGWDFRDADDFHPIENIRKMAAGDPLTDDDRAGWLNTLRELCLDQIRGGRDTVLACSALKRSYRRFLQIDQQVKFVLLEADFSTVQQRLSGRKDHFLDDRLLSSQFETLERSDGEVLAIDARQTPEASVEQITSFLSGEK